MHLHYVHSHACRYHPVWSCRRGATLGEYISDMFCWFEQCTNLLTPCNIHIRIAVSYAHLMSYHTSRCDDFDAGSAGSVPETRIPACGCGCGCGYGQNVPVSGVRVPDSGKIPGRHAYFPAFTDVIWFCKYVQWLIPVMLRFCEYINPRAKAWIYQDLASWSLIPSLIYSTAQQPSLL